MWIKWRAEGENGALVTHVDSEWSSLLSIYVALNNVLTLLSLSFLVWKMGTITVPTL